jgi:hypothetical protein
VTSTRDPLRQTHAIVDLDFGNGRKVAAEVFAGSAPVIGSAPEDGWSQSDAGFADRLAETRDAVLEQAAPAIGAMADWVHDQLIHMGTRAPDRVGVDMGVKFVAKSSGLVAPVIGQLGGEATLLVRLEWDVRAAAVASGAAPAGDDDDDDDDGSSAGAAG